MNQSTNQSLNQNPSGTQAQNLNQGPTVAIIHAELRMKDVDVGIITPAGVKTSDDGTWKLVRLAGKKKVSFDVATEKDTFLEVKQEVGRNPSKLQIIDMPSSFDPSVEAGPL